MAIIGYGLSGGLIHAGLLEASPNYRVKVVVTRHHQRRDQAKMRFPSAVVMDSTVDLWKRSDDLDLVIIATPNALHVPIALTALRQGLHVVVEKPIAATSVELDAVLKTAMDSQRQVHAFQNRRWDADFLTMRQMISQGTIGQLQHFSTSMESQSPRSTKAWKESSDAASQGGVLLDLGTHLVDQALLLLGPITSVSARARNLRGFGEAEDDVEILARHLGAKTSKIVLSRARPKSQPRLTAEGSRGILIAEDYDIQEDQLRMGITPRAANWGVQSHFVNGTLFATPGESETTFSTAYARGAWPDFYDGVFHSIRDSSPLPVPLDDLILLTQSLDMIRRSSDMNGIWVHSAYNL